MNTPDLGACEPARSLPATDAELLGVMKRISAAERTLTAHALRHLAEIARRGLFADAGYSSMFYYCVGELRYSEATAYRRVQAVEAVGRHPAALDMIKDGRITVCALAVVAKHMTAEDGGRILAVLVGKSARDAKRLAAELAPRPDTKDTVRALPAPAPAAALAPVPVPRDVHPPSCVTSEAGASDPAPDAGASDAAPEEPSRRAEEFKSQKIVARSLGRYLFSFTGGEELSKAIERLRELLWHRFTEGRLEDVILETAREYLRRNDPEMLKPSKPRRPRAVETRTSPRWVKSVVYRRDRGRCVYTSVAGKRCEARRGLEYDHIRPWALGGRSDDPDNIRLLCRVHNQAAARAAGLA